MASLAVSAAKLAIKNGSYQMTPMDVARIAPKNSKIVFLPSSMSKLAMPAGAAGAVPSIYISDNTPPAS